jgi:flagellar biosynthesis protein FlhA
MTVSQEMEEAIAVGINQSEYGSYLALEPQQANGIIESLKKAIDRATLKIEQPVILCSTTVRRHLKKLCERFQLQVAVLSYNEIPSGLQVETVEDVTLGS